MGDLDRLTALRLEQLRRAWEFATHEAEVHRQRHLQFFLACLTLGMTILASVFLERLAAWPALGFSSSLLLGALYGHLRMTRVPRRLRRALSIQTATIDRLMREEPP